MRLVVFSAVFGLIAGFSGLAHGQVITQGFNMQEEQGALESTDPVFSDGRHYRNLTFTMKAGESAMLYMIASSFEPYIYTVDSNMQGWVTGTNEIVNYNYASVIWFTATRDTSFYIVYTSAYPGQTGTFIYGFRNVTEVQQQYANASNSCDRLNYMLNNWQLFNGFFPTAYTNDTGNRITRNTWKPGATAIILNMTNYRERVYTGDTEANLTGYDAVVTEIQSCINKEQWDVTTDSYVDDITGTVVNTTYFTVKGANQGQALNSFAVVWMDDPLGNNTIDIELY